MHRVNFKSGISRIYNLHNVNVVELNTHKKKIMFKFNTQLNLGSMVMGSGEIKSELHEESVTYDKESDAIKDFEEIALSIRRIE